MKKKSDGMSPDMFRDATSSTPIPVFTSVNEKNETKNPLQDVTDNFTTVGKPTVVKLQDELIKIDFDKQTVSARALYTFFELEERFSKWFKRMISYGLVENVDFTAVSFVICHKQPNDFTNIPFAPPVPFGTGGVPFGTGGVPLFTDVNNGVYQDIGDYLLTIEAAKHIAMVQRNEKGKQARQYFIDVEKLYLKNVYSKNQTDANIVEKMRNLLIEHGEIVSRKDYNLLAEKMVALEQKLAVHNLKDEYIERTISKKVDIALKSTFREAGQISSRDEIVNRLPQGTNQNSTVVLNQLQKSLQKTTLEEDLIRKCYRPAERRTENAIFLTATEMTHHLETFSKKVMIRYVGIALKKLGFEKVHHSIDEKPTKGYFVIQL